MEPHQLSSELVDEALSWAARNGQCESMAALVEIGADVNANPYRGTPLLWAIYDDRVDAAAWLLDRGADPTIQDAAFGGTPLGWAQHADTQSSIKLLTRQ